MADQQVVSRDEPVYEQTVDQGFDSLTKAMVYAIIFIVILALTGFLYLLLGGFFGANTPRTALEAQLVILEDAAVKYPGSGVARKDYIIALEASAQPREADQEYERALEECADGEKTIVYDAGVTLLFNRGEYEEAVDLADEALAHDDAVREAMTQESAARGTRLYPSSFDNTYRISILLTSARAQGADGDWSAAVDRLTKALELDPRGADILGLRAYAYEQMGETEKAIADYREALRFIPDNATALDGLERLGSQ